MPDFGIGETLAAFLATVGVGAETASIAAPIIVGGLEGAGLGAAGSAITGGDPGRGALFGGLAGGVGGGFGELFSGAGEAGAAGVGTETGATFADSLTPATSGIAGGAIDAGAFDASFGGLSSLPAGVPAALTTNDLASLGATTPPTIGAAPVTPSLASGAVPTPTAVAPAGLEASATPTASALGVTGPAPAAGPGVTAFAAPPGVTGALDPTSAAALATQADLVPAGTAELGADVVTPGGAGALEGPTATGATLDAASGALQGPTAAGGTLDGSGPSLLSRIGGGIGDTVDSAGKFLSSPTGKVLGVGLTGASLLKDLLSLPQIPGLSGLSNLANAQSATGHDLIKQGLANNKGPTDAATTLASGAASQGATLSSYLTSGTLPPGVQTAINNAATGTIAAIRSRHAAQGTSGSSAEAQEIASARQNAVTQGTSIASDLLSKGTSLESLAAQVYQGLIGQNNTLLTTGASLTGTAGSTLNALVNQNVSENNAVNTAIANLASALGGGTKITLTGTQAA